MAKILFGVIAVLASLMLVESLTCNKCSNGILGYCLSASQVTCTSNTSLCFTGKATFTGLTSVGFNTQGCLESIGCNTNTTSSLLGVSYTTQTTCCSTDQCNPVQASGAPSTKMTLTAAIGVAVLASMWGSIL
ncbi:sperm acrosome membrane-associated protein 4-like [Micropterus dolomieu]|uniref:sperm acrosome membrane-associated protein 4-like n=1 Tax=Micropterus dolomieu TaxID=147949 RepID=UPI001E8CD38F|nr:sperm acrosome membrane-associated protein 4-like [Micropterus dolomieu]